MTEFMIKTQEMSTSLFGQFVFESFVYSFNIHSVFLVLETLIKGTNLNIKHNNTLKNKRKSKVL